MKRSDRVTIKIKCRTQKQPVMYKRKDLDTKPREILNLKFLGRLFVSEELFHENQQIAYKCRQIKGTNKIHSNWFFNNVANAKRHTKRYFHPLMRKPV